MESNPYFRPILRWWWIIVLGTVLAGGSAFIVTRDSPMPYVASTTVIVGTSIADPNPTGAEFGLTRQLAQIYADLAARDPIRENTAKALSLQSLPDYNVAVLPNSSLLVITVTDIDPRRAAAVANELASELVQTSPEGSQSTIQNRQAFVNQQLNDLQNSITETQSAIETAQARLATLNSAVEITDAQAQLSALQSKLSVLQSNYASLLSVTTQGALNTLTIVQPATVPTAPVGLSRPMLVALASLIGLALSIGTAHLLELLDNRVRLPEDVTRLTDWTVYGDMSGAFADDFEVSSLARLGQSEPRSESLLSMLDSLRFAPMLEYMRSLVLSDLSLKGSSGLLAACLGLTFAETGKNVVLIDADLHHPTLGSWFELSSEEGLAEAASASRDMTSGEKVVGLDDLVLPTDFEHLSIVVAGDVTKNVLRTSIAGIVRELIGSISDSFDLVIVVAPSMVHSRDGLILTRSTEGVLLVVDSGDVRRDDLVTVAEELEAVAATVVGAVFNSSPRRLRADLPVDETRLDASADSGQPQEAEAS